MPCIENPVLQWQHTVRLAASLPQVAKSDSNKHLVVEALLHEGIDIVLCILGPLIFLDGLQQSVHQAPECAALGVYVYEMRPTVISFYSEQASQERLINVYNSKQYSVLDVDVYMMISAKKCHMSSRQLTVFLGHERVTWRCLGCHASHFLSYDAVNTIGTNKHISIIDFVIRGEDVYTSASLANLMDSLIDKDL